MPLTMALQLAGTITLLVWRVGSAGLVGFAVLALLLLVSTRVVRRMNQQEQQLKASTGRATNGILAEYIKKLRLVRQNGLGLLHRGGQRQAPAGLGVLGRVLRLDAPQRKGLMLGTPLLVTLATPFTRLHLMSRAAPSPLPQVFTTIALFTVLRIPMITAALPHPAPDQLQHRFQPAVRVPQQPQQPPGSHRPQPAGGGNCNGWRHRPAPAKPVLEDQSHHRAGGSWWGSQAPTGRRQGACLHLVAGFDDGFGGSIPSPRPGRPPGAQALADERQHPQQHPCSASPGMSALSLGAGACALTAAISSSSVTGIRPWWGPRHPPLRRSATAGSPWPAPSTPGRYPAAGQPLSALDPRGRGPRCWHREGSLQAGADPAAGEP